MWTIEIQVNENEWKRMATRYKTRKCAKPWLHFVKTFYHAKHAKTVKVYDKPALDGVEE